MGKVFVGHDWAESHHDVFVEDDTGRKLAAARLPEGIEGVRRFHELVAPHAGEASDVLIASETDRGLFVSALIAAGYDVLAVNPMATKRYRERFSSSGAKSDAGDAQVLASAARTDGHMHRRVSGDSDLAEAVKVLARAHQSMVWARQRHVNQMRSALREYFPAALGAFDELASNDALAVLAIAPTPALARKLSKAKIASVLRRGGRQRRVEERAEEIRNALRVEHLEAPAVVADAMGASVAALAAVVAQFVTQIDRLEQEIADRFNQHPDAKIILSLPGLGTILGARALGEFGDDPNRFNDAKSRKNYASTSPITRASGQFKVVLARYARNGRLADACYLWAFASLTASPGARAYYDQRRAKGDTHNRAIRALANRLVGILHGCLEHGTLYNEHTAWAHRAELAA